MDGIPLPGDLSDTGARKRLLMALPWLVVDRVLSTAATRLGLGVTPDSGHYLAVADNLVAGHGFVRLGSEIMEAAVHPSILTTNLTANLNRLALI